MTTTTTRGFCSPGRYFQGPGEILNIRKHTSGFGTKVFALIDTVFHREYTKVFSEIYTGPDDRIRTELFGGECCDSEIDRVCAMLEKEPADVVVGMGGGKTLDTMKVVADRFRLPVIVVPTTASTDAPCSAMSIIYTEAGAHLRSANYLKNPDIVLVDTRIIVKAPIVFLVAGMGDAISTYFEAEVNRIRDLPNYVDLATGPGYRRTLTGYAIAKFCYDTIRTYGIKARLDAEAGACTDAFENVVEANTLMSGLGFENVGCAAAHGLNYTFSIVPRGMKVLHGIRVAYGVLVQLVLEGRLLPELEDLLGFYSAVGLPVTLEDTGVDPSRETMETMAKASMGVLLSNEPVKVTWEIVYDAMVSVEALGRRFKAKARTSSET